MALGLILIGFILIAAGVKGTQGEIARLLATEFTGAGNFWFFIAGIFLLGSIGYYTPLRGTSRLLIFLTLLVFVLTNGGFWEKLVQGLGSPIAAPAPDKEAVPAPADIQQASAEITGALPLGNLSGAAQMVAGASGSEASVSSGEHDGGGTTASPGGAGTGNTGGAVNIAGINIGSAADAFDMVAGIATGGAGNLVGGLAGQFAGATLGSRAGGLVGSLAGGFSTGGLKGAASAIGKSLMGFL